MHAAENNYVEKVKALLHHGANINLQDELGETAVMIAARENCKEAVRVLIGAGAQLDVTNYEQMTAADVTLDDDIDVQVREAQQPGSGLKYNL